MEGIAESSNAQLNAPYAERWELLKDIMVHLYIDEKTQLKDLVAMMKARYQFYASEGQYKGQFKRWKIGKAIPAKKKEGISKTLQSRAQLGKSSVVLYKDRPVENKTIRRYLKDQARREIAIGPSMINGTSDLEFLSGHALQCGNRVFMNWNVPYSVLCFPKARAEDNFSPFGQAATPMSDIVAVTPSSNSGPSPRNPPSPGHALSPNNAPSPLTVAVRDKMKADRAHLFVQGQHARMLQGMNKEDKSLMTDWMHQFWQFSFKTAKNWGRGPRKWTASTLRFGDFSARRLASLPSSPAVNFGSPENHDYQQNIRKPGHDAIQKPTSLCRWSIHHRDTVEVDPEGIASPPPVEEADVDPNDESSWKPWSTQENIQQFAVYLQENLESNDFSNMEVENLPILANKVARAAEQYNKDFTLHDVFPLHLATSYLDGARTCCGIFDTIVANLPMREAPATVRKLYTNHLNHTVLDNLMIAILKAHTSCAPATVDDAFKKEHRFVGEEVDICGRWDADSDCIRQLQALGNPTIPFEWKHMFCHASVQAISHCIGMLWNRPVAPDINTPSGLFLKRCSNELCGLKLQLRPLHTLVVTTVHLAQQGCKGENLFGMLACLLRMVKSGANPLLTAHISVKALLSSDDEQECSHSELTPLELTREVPKDLVRSWSLEARTGWKVFCTVLNLCNAEWRSRKEDAMSSNDEDNLSLRMCDDHDIPCTNQKLATLWAAVQTELVTYRRLAEGDAWISPNFNMESLLESLNGGSDLAIGLVENDMMEEFCSDCGVFPESMNWITLGTEEVSAYYFSNLEDWNRSTFIEINE
ncbi:hypothetical protein DL98DRAFT_586407 [Cadophora sp. DSE1049]|nr:hypothetical protein DL98DRAFT_586407 [Cadophora sp. DSE1049]